MNEQKGGPVAPLFYIIQPMIEIKRSAQNNQEIFHSREVIVEKTPAPIEAEQEKIVTNQSEKEIKGEMKRLSSEFNTPGNIQAKGLRKMEELIAAKEEERVLLKDEAIHQSNTMITEDKQIKVQNVHDDESIEDYKKYVRTTITRLARYPLVVPKPVCELTIRGEKMNAVIESKRGKMVIIRVGADSQSIAINDIEDVKIL